MSVANPLEKSGKEGMTFDAMETLERHSDSIDKLTFLVCKNVCENGQKTNPI